MTLCDTTSKQNENIAVEILNRKSDSENLFARTAEIHGSSKFVASRNLAIASFLPCQFGAVTTQEELQHQINEYEEFLNVTTSLPSQLVALSATLKQKTRSHPTMPHQVVNHTTWFLATVAQFL